MTPAGKFKIGI